MCVTFTGCELLCSETLSWQQKSHATLKSKLRVQIKMKVMKDRNAKACWGFVWIKPMGDWDIEREAVWFSQWVRGRPQTRCANAPGEGTKSLVIPVCSGSRWNQEWVQELMPLTLLCLGGEEFGGPRQMALEARKSPGGCFMIPGKSHRPRGFLPQGRRKRCFPCSPLSLIETKTRLNISANRIYKNLSKWTSRWVGGLTWTLT